MKRTLPLFASAACVPAALLFTPAFAQDAATQAAPPPVVSTVPAAPAPAAPERVFAPPAPVVQQVPETPAPIATATPAPAQRTTTVRSTRTTTTRAPAPAPAAPAASFTPPEPQPATAQPAPVAATPAPAPAPAAETQATTTKQSRAPVWPWLALVGLIVLGAIAAFALLRRRDADEDVYVEDSAPNYEAAPLAEATPVVLAAESSHSEVERADAEDVAALTAGSHEDRPWLEFALRPVRAGTNVDEALVEVELTVGNAGSETAKDVRVSTFMLADHGAALKRMLADAPPSGAVTEQVTIKPGEGARIEATLARPRATLREEEGTSFRPVVVAEARYTLPDGTEGRTSASFDIGVAEDDEEGFDPVTLDQTRIYDNVEARLHGKPVHA